jgi:hypothetical protein
MKASYAEVRRAVMAGARRVEGLWGKSPKPAEKWESSQWIFSCKIFHLNTGA